MSERVERSSLLVAPVLDAFVKNELLIDTDITVELFWNKFSELLSELTPKNIALLEKREELQEQIDEWHRVRRGAQHNSEEYKQFLVDIGYLQPEHKNFQVETLNVDHEITSIAGPQLVVPVMNARFALNASNARWGSLYDALYGTDVIDAKGGREKLDVYNPTRGTAVIEYATQVLDSAFPLEGISHSNVKKYFVSEGHLLADTAPLTVQSQFVGYLGEPQTPSAILLQNNGLHIEIQIDREHPIGKFSSSGVKDVLLEAAITTIQDMEDSVAAVDAEDKVLAYQNLLGLYRGTLEETFEKNDTTVTRRLNPDRIYKNPDGREELVLPGRSLLLIRNVGHLMTNSAVLDRNGNEVPEGIMDAMFTGVIGLHDLKSTGNVKNSRTGSIYIVKPKMHGPEEVSFACEIFQWVEEAIGIPKNSIKIGIMDEERRTTVNLRNCIEAAKHRVVFINTGFLDRTGDEIHTSMEAGPFLPKADIKQATWIKAYEDWNVDVGIESGMHGIAQIGKGMWAMPDEMASMMKAKIEHPRAGATTAWVPSPTAATLHAIHYHQVNVLEIQSELAERPRASLDQILEIPLLDGRNLSPREIKNELENNCQGILGYVVRWVEQGVGCSKVPDINNIGLMEDRATLRISSQHIANWLYHEVCSPEEVMETLERMAKIVDEQNEDDENYLPMSNNFSSSNAFSAACDLIFRGREQPSGYTEPILHQKRLQAKRTD